MGRGVVFVVFSALTLGLLSSYPSQGDAQEEPRTEMGIKTISAIEELSREHGLLARIFNIYQKIIVYIDSNKPFAPAALYRSAKIVKEYFENYHENLEEDYIFPRFAAQASDLGNMVRILAGHHQRGRELTNDLLAHATPEQLQISTTRQAVRDHLVEFVSMMENHLVLEDTVLFPAYEAAVSLKEYDYLGQLFASKRQQLFGSDGFKKTVDEVAAIEKLLDIQILVPASSYTEDHSKLR